MIKKNELTIDVKQLEVLPKEGQDMVLGAISYAPLATCRDVSYLEKVIAACKAYMAVSKTAINSYNMAKSCQGVARSRLEEIRNELGMSQESFAKENNFSRDQVRGFGKLKSAKEIKEAEEIATSEGRKLLNSEIEVSSTSRPSMSAAYWVSNAISNLKKAADVEKNEAKKAKWLWHVEELER